MVYILLKDFCVRHTVVSPPQSKWEPKKTSPRQKTRGRAAIVGTDLPTGEGCLTASSAGFMGHLLSLERCDIVSFRKGSVKKFSGGYENFFSVLHQLSGVDLDAGAHGGGDDAALHIGALGGGGLGLQNGAHEGVEVLAQLLGAEGDLADGAVDDVGLVQTVLHLTGLGFLHSASHVGGDGASLGGGHEALGPSSLPRRPTTLIMSGEAMTTSKSNQFSCWIFWARSASPT